MYNLEDFKKWLRETDANSAEKILNDVLTKQYLEGYLRGNDLSECIRKAQEPPEYVRNDFEKKVLLFKDYVDTEEQKKKKTICITAKNF